MPRVRAEPAPQPFAHSDVFRQYVEDFAAGGSPLYSELARGCIGSALVARIIPAPDRFAPLRLFGGVHYLMLAATIERFPRSWPELEDVLVRHGGWLRDWVERQPVQTNEVQRSWALLLGFLSVAGETGRPLDLVELGPSGGLNLVWDRYRYRYGDRLWGRPGAALELSAELRAPPPGRLLELVPEVGSRVGIDRDPVDLTSAEGARLLEAFVWADQRARRERLRRAIEELRRGPPRLVRGDYVRLLPELLAERDLSRLTVVFQSVSIDYLPEADRSRLFGLLEREGARGSLAWLTLGSPDHRVEHGYALVSRIWPGEARVLARAGHHGQWLEWLG